MEYHFYGCLLDQWFTKSCAVNDGMLERKCCREEIFHGERIMTRLRYY